MRFFRHGDLLLGKDTEGMKEIDYKYRKLTETLERAGRIAVAFSAGVDSTLLLRAAADALGADHVLAVTALSHSFPERENREAEQLCRDYGVRRILVEVDQLSIPGFRENPPDRCYLCKKVLFSKMIEAARERGFDKMAEGSNIDDLSDYRPGLKAVAELGVISPLREAGLSKSEIRELSGQLGLPTWNKPSFACLATRFVYGETISNEKLLRVEKSEGLLQDLGFGQFRVRIHGDDGRLARIEVPQSEFGKLMERRQEITRKLREFGFSYVSLDLEGYRIGSMNEVLPEITE